MALVCVQHARTYRWRFCSLREQEAISDDDDTKLIRKEMTPTTTALHEPFRDVK